MTAASPPPPPPGAPSPPPPPLFMAAATAIRARVRGLLAAAGLEWVSPADVAALLAGAGVLFHPLLGVWMFAEGCFYVYQSYRSHIIHSEPVAANAAIEPERRAELQQRLLDLGDVLGVDDFFSGWFHGAPAGDIKRGNVLEFIAYGFYCKPLPDLDTAERADVDQYVERVEAKRGKPFPPGHNPAATFMAHLWEPLRVLHKPLALHAAGEAMRGATAAALWCLGFQAGTSPVGGVKYWVRPPGAPPLRPAALAWAVRSVVGLAGVVGPHIPPRLRAAVTAFVGRGRGSGGGGEVTDGGGGGASSLAPVPRPEEVEEGEEEKEESGPAGVSSALPPPAAGALRARGGGGGGRVGGAARPPHLLSLPPRPTDSVASLEDADAAAPSPQPLAPLLFVHGVGLGLTPYLHFIAELAAAAPDRHLLLVEARHVSVGLASRAASTCDVATAVCSILDAHAWPAAACVGHSYGTFVLSRLAQAHPARVQALALVDPVCLLTIYPQLLRNFVYKPAAVLASLKAKSDPARFGAPLGAAWRRWRPGKGGRPTSEDGSARRSTISSTVVSPSLATIDTARWLFSRDLVVAEAFCRRFVWHRECLWPAELDAGTTLLVLAGQDDLVPSSLVRRLLDRAPPGQRPTIDMDVDAGHGGFLVDGAWRARVVAGIVSVADAGTAKARAQAQTAGGAAAAAAAAPAPVPTLASSPPKAAPAAVLLSRAMVKRGEAGGGGEGGGLIQAGAAE